MWDAIRDDEIRVRHQASQEQRIKGQEEVTQYWKEKLRVAVEEGPKIHDYGQMWRDLDAEAYEIRALAQQEYASDLDIFENFRRLSALVGISPRHCILVLMMKHLCSIEKGITIRESMKGRYIDVMNYLRLLYAWDSTGEK